MKKGSSNTAKMGIKVRHDGYVMVGQSAISQHPSTAAAATNVQ